MAINNIEPYDFSEAYWVDTSDIGGIQYTLYGVVVVDTTRVAKLERSVTFNGDEGEDTWTVDISSSISDPNGEHMVNIDILGSVLAVTYNVYDSSGKLIQTAEIPEGNDWDLSNAYISTTGNSMSRTYNLSGVTGSTPECTQVYAEYYDTEGNMDGSRNVTVNITNNQVDGIKLTSTSMSPYTFAFTLVQLLRSNGSIIASATNLETVL